jgi:adenine-specific DNA-methyltransferase
MIKINFESNYLFNSDNLEFLNEYKDQLRGKINLISIDPPYNTGKQMGKYSDNFSDMKSWMNFLKPRLEIAKDILSEDGLIFININDKNSPYLRILCDKIFDIKNHLSTIVWQCKYTVSNDKKGITTQTENILVYCKNPKEITINSDGLDPEYAKVYKNYDDDPRGPWRKGVQLFKKKTTKTYTVKSPTGKEWTKGWNYSETEWYNTLVKEDLIYWGEDGNSCPTKKVFLQNSKGKGIRNLWLGEEVGYTQNGTKDLENILNVEAAFLYPKPVKLIKRIIQIASKEDSIILDFFAGSGTLGQAVIEYNKDNENSNRKFIMVTNNESNICESITLPRMKKIITTEPFIYISEK